MCTSLCICILMLQLSLQRGLNQISQKSMLRTESSGGWGPDQTERMGNEAGQDNSMETTGWVFKWECPLRKGGKLEICRPKESTVLFQVAVFLPLLGTWSTWIFRALPVIPKVCQPQSQLLSRVWGQVFKSQHEMQYSSSVAPTTVLELPPNAGHAGTVLS